MEKRELSDVISENCSKINGEINRSNFEKLQTVLNQIIILRIILQRTECNYKTGQYCKNETKIAPPSQYSMSFSVNIDEVVYILVSIIFMKLIQWIVVTNTVMYWIIT